MAYLLRTLLAVSFLAFLFTLFCALGWIDYEFHHIYMAIPLILFLIFVQAFVMFYFIGVHRLVTNIYYKLHEKKELKELFEKPPEDLSPYLDKTKRFHYQSNLAKKKTIPWTMMILFLGILGFLLGGAHHTGVVNKIIHAGVIYGFMMAFIIGFSKQWKYLGQNHLLLRKIKGLFSLSDHSM